MALRQQWMALPHLQLMSVILLLWDACCPCCVHPSPHPFVAAHFVLHEVHGKCGQTQQLVGAYGQGSKGAWHEVTRARPTYLQMQEGPAFGLPAASFPAFLPPALLP